METKRAGEAVLAVMEKNREKKKRYGRFLAELSISPAEPSEVHNL